MEDYPKTKEEWWKLVDTWWKHLESIVLNYYPNQSDFPEDGLPVNFASKTQACDAQLACNHVIKELRKENPVWDNKTLFKKYINNLKETRNSKLASIFNSAWFGIPENTSSRRISGFYVFCDLCSEAYVLDDTKPDGREE